MQNIKQKTNKGLVQHQRCKSFGAGFALLFAITISAILLAIALGVSNIALKEVKFSTSAKDTNDAFFAADTGAEYTLFQDKDPSNYPVSGSPYSFTRPALGSTEQGCAIITVNKTSTTTTIISKGYNTGWNGTVCNPTGSNTVERELQITY